MYQRKDADQRKEGAKDQAESPVRRELDFGCPGQILVKHLLLLDTFPLGSPRPLHACQVPIAGIASRASKSAGFYRH